ncbi:MAG TPA: OsmC family protein [Gaiellaceae bacterium]|nr:OsmC family protein [Gaiellaceae bacterium]
MSSARARSFEYGVSVDRGWAVRSDRGGGVLDLGDPEWSPEHLLLAGLARCTLTSFRYHVRQAGLETVSSAEASGTVTRREEDGRFAFVEIDVAVEATLEPAPGKDDVRDLVAKGERDCFVGASLTPRPRYRWTVNGEEIT